MLFRVAASNIALHLQMSHHHSGISAVWYIRSGTADVKPGFVRGRYSPFYLLNLFTSTQRHQSSVSPVSHLPLFCTNLCFAPTFVLQQPLLCSNLYLAQNSDRHQPISHTAPLSCLKLCLAPISQGQPHGQNLLLEAKKICDLYFCFLFGCNSFK